MDGEVYEARWAGRQTADRAPPHRVAAVPFADIASTPVYALMAFGVTLAAMGHLFGDRRIVAIGLAVLFLATGLLLAGAYQAYDEQGPLGF